MLSCNRHPSTKQYDILIQGLARRRPTPHDSELLCPSRFGRVDKQGSPISKVVDRAHHTPQVLSLEREFWETINRWHSWMVTEYMVHTHRYDPMDFTLMRCPMRAFSCWNVTKASVSWGSEMSRLNRDPHLFVFINESSTDNKTVQRTSR